MALFRRNENVYLVDKSNKFPTRIQVQTGQKFRLQRGDFLSIGLDQDIAIVECISKNFAKENDEGGVVNIRWVPPGVSTFLTNDRTDPTHT